MHPNPAKAVSDGAQSLDVPMFNEMMRDMDPYVDIWRQSRVKELAAVV